MSGFHILPDPNKFRLEPGELPIPPFTNISYGALYNYYAANDPRGITSSGWHIPTIDEYTALSTYLGGSSVSGGKLKEIDFTYWYSPNTGATNETGFSGRGAGWRMYNGSQILYILQKYYSYFWTSTYTSGIQARVVGLRYNSTAFSIGGWVHKPTGASLRAVKDTTILLPGQSGFYIGNDGKVYRTIAIGEPGSVQEWLAENLAETKYRNGDDIIYQPNDDLFKSPIATVISVPDPASGVVDTFSGGSRVTYSQSFITTGGYIDNIYLKGCTRIGNANFTIGADIYSSVNGIPSVKLYSADHAFEIITASLIGWNFPNVYLPAGEYFMVFPYSNYVHNATNYGQLAVTSNTYGDGVLMSSINGVDWSAIPSLDLHIYMTDSYGLMCVYNNDWNNV